jgi:hypothetical protein
MLLRLPSVGAAFHLEEIRKRKDFDDRKLWWLQGRVRASGFIDGYDCANSAGCVDLGTALKKLTRFIRYASIRAALDYCLGGIKISAN